MQTFPAEVAPSNISDEEVVDLEQVDDDQINKASGSRAKSQVADSYDDDNNDSDQCMGCLFNGYDDYDEEEEEEDNRRDPKFFADSSHQYLIYWGHTNHKSKDFTGFLVGIVALIIEWSLLSFMVAEGQQLIKEDLIPVMVRYGSSCHHSDFMKDFKCEAGVADFGANILAPVLLAIFLTSDTVIALKGMFISKGVVAKIGSMALFFVSCYAGYVGGLFAFQGVFNGSTYDAIVNCVGVLFITDIDEKAFATYQAVKDVVDVKSLRDKTCCTKGCCKINHRAKFCMLCCFLVFVIIAISPSMIETTELAPYPMPSQPSVASYAGPAPSPVATFPSYPSSSFSSNDYPSYRR